MSLVDAVVSISFSLWKFGSPWFAIAFLALVNIMCQIDTKQTETKVMSEPEPPLIPSKLIWFTVNLIGGLACSQLFPTIMSEDVYHVFEEIIAVLTMTALSFIMINVGYDFDIDKAKWKSYIKDYLVGELSDDAWKLQKYWPCTWCVECRMGFSD